MNVRCQVWRASREKQKVQKSGMSDHHWQHLVQISTDANIRRDRIRHAAGASSDQRLSFGSLTKNYRDQSRNGNNQISMCCFGEAEAFELSGCRLFRFQDEASATAIAYHSTGAEEAS